MDEHTIYHHLLEALAQPACPICRLCERAVASHLDHLLYADVTSVERRAEIRAAQGFCAEHAQALQEIGRALGIAIIYKDVLDNLLRALPAAPAPRRLLGRPSAGDPLPPPAACPACLYSDVMQEVYIGGLIKHLDNPEFRQALTASDGLCLTHFRATAGHKMDAGRRDFLLAQQTERWERLSAELGEYIRKNDYRFRDEGFGAERDAWQRASQSVSGGRRR
jgi:hypothetical protein